ncbi:hypothetical protein BC938DRAFT_476286, partial [Jimgerdemannia flammicorona]
ARALAESLKQNTTLGTLNLEGVFGVANIYIPSSSKLSIILDENIMDRDLIAQFIAVLDVRAVTELRLRDMAYEDVIKRAQLDGRILVTCNTDYLSEHGMARNGILVLWGRLGNKRFVRLTKKERRIVVPGLFQTHRLKMEEVRNYNLVRFAILSGNDLNDFKWEIRPPTDEELTRYFLKYVEKEGALPSPMPQDAQRRRLKEGRL